MQSYIIIIQKLIKEIKQIEIIYYKVACDNYTIYSEVDYFNDKFGKFRMETHRVDWIYFHKIRGILDKNIKNPQKALNLIKKIEEPDGALEHYGDVNYINIIRSIARRVIELNETLDDDEKLQEVADLELEIRKMQSKKNITVKEFAEIYNVSKTSQQNYRSRLYDPLPYHQKVQGGKIVYVVEEVEQWFENQHK